MVPNQLPKSESGTDFSLLFGCVEDESEVIEVGVAEDNCVVAGVGEETCGVVVVVSEGARPKSNLNPNGV